jgi:hypothetical protein
MLGVACSVAEEEGCARKKLKGEDEDGEGKLDLNSCLKLLENAGKLDGWYHHYSAEEKRWELPE